VITPQRYEIGCQLLLTTNRKSHVGFRLVPTSMTVNDLDPVGLYRTLNAKVGVKHLRLWLGKHSSSLYPVRGWSVLKGCRVLLIF